MRIDTVLAADIGSVSVALVEVDGELRVVQSRYREHGGRAEAVLLEMLADWDLSRVVRTATTASSPGLFHADDRIDWLTAHVSARRVLSPDHDHLLVVGGERFAFIRFDGDGNYRSSRGNSSCAAGTGGFLDQQARRLGLDGAAHLAALAASNEKQRPRIASRCSVFAKTDLIHAQQEGYGLPEICDGLCYGLARNLVDAVISGTPPDGSVAVAGGVALNETVVKYIGEVMVREVVASEAAPTYAAVGAAVAAWEQRSWTDRDDSGRVSVQDLVRVEGSDRSYYHERLPAPSAYPDFDRHYRYVFSPTVDGALPVEVDDYTRDASGDNASVESDSDGTSETDEGVYLGIDVGSTSTKAVLVLASGEVTSAYYTRTAGKPLVAVRALFEAVSDRGADGPIVGAACTGSGRKLIGGVVGADLVLDEISAHARAAVDLDPETDTIIEIGGQDAKFTTVKNGRVTFSQMNSVCAAGTGSFLEEQAIRLNVPISSYADRAIGKAAPLTSDRCTVFMERDLNHFLNRGYATDELLAAALHSVRENYLQTVAHLSAIGDHVCFQGATAKNRALVAAFEARLGKPISVSRYCHVTGALGAALTCRDEHCGKTTFRGIGLYRQDIPVRTERCELCTNHCRLTVADVAGQTVAYGFLCGRDYETNTFVSSNTSGFDLMATRRRILGEIRRGAGGVGSVGPHRVGAGIADALRGVGERIDVLRGAREWPNGITVGMPVGLHLADEYHFWERVFIELGIRVKIAAGLKDAVQVGKQIEGAEFCAPVAAFHGQVKKMLETTDLVFLPIALEPPDQGKRKRAYCYYTQFTPSVLAGTVSDHERDRLLMPVLWGGSDEPAEELRRVFLPWVDLRASRIRGAMRIARDAEEAARRQLKEVFLREREGRTDDQFDVAILGRPYTALDPVMNKSIPDIFGRLGVRVFSQDMLPHALPSDSVRDLVDAVHWRFAAEILLAADYVSTTPGLYPVLITSFKCAPDAFSIESFRRILDDRQKPYLILQLDEHDSSIGYETRIEAAVRAFANHRARSRRSVVLDAAVRRPSVSPPLEEVVGDRTMLLPNWDPITSPLLAANLRAHGVNTITLEESPLSIRRSMRLNSGQCIPVSAIAQEAIDYVRDHALDPSRYVLWMGKSNWACGIPLYPQFLKGVFVQEGLGELGVYVGDFTYTDISPMATVGAYFAYQIGGWIRRIACSTRPYEKNPGQTDALVEKWRQRFETVIEFKGDRLQALHDMIADLTAVPVERTPRPKVAIFGDLYVRDNDVMNQDLVHRIEEAGGEAVTTPYSDYVKIIGAAHFERLRRNGEYADYAKLRLIAGVIGRLERKYQREVEPILGPALPWRRSGIAEELRRFGMVPDQEGESYENALKIQHLINRYDDLSLFVQTSPAFCCPSMVTEALASSVERITGIPIVTITYDGTEGDKNSVIVPYIKYARTGEAV